MESGFGYFRSSRIFSQRRNQDPGDSYASKQEIRMARNQG
jgi:hypothetical protein